jgi:hypothetical protein
MQHEQGDGIVTIMRYEREVDHVLGHIICLRDYHHSGRVHHQPICAQKGTGLLGMPGELFRDQRRRALQDLPPCPAYDQGHPQGEGQGQGVEVVLIGVFHTTHKKSTHDHAYFFYGQGKNSGWVYKKYPIS